MLGCQTLGRALPDTTRGAGPAKRRVGRANDKGRRATKTKGSQDKTLQGITNPYSGRGPLLLHGARSKRHKPTYNGGGLGMVLRIESQI